MIPENLEVQRLAWERDDRSKNEPAKRSRLPRSPIESPTAGRKTSTWPMRKAWHTSRRKIRRRTERI